MAEAYEEFEITCQDSVTLFGRKNVSPSPRATLIIVHGLCEHSGRYDHVAAHLTAGGYHVYRFDLRGHGRSSGERGYVDKYEDFITDTQAVVTLAENTYPSLPIFMLGHSMGGTITALYGLTYPAGLAGQIFSGAAVIVLPLFQDLSSLDYNQTPFQPIPNALADMISRDTRVVQAYKDDPLVLKEFTFKLMGEMFIRGAKDIMARAAEYRYPCLILHGGADAIVTPDASQYWYEHIASPDKKAIIYDGLYHEILNEPERATVLADIDHWLKERL